MDKKISIRVSGDEESRYHTETCGRIEGTPDNYSISFDALLSDSLDEYHIRFHAGRIVMRRKGENDITLYVKQGMRALIVCDTPLGQLKTGCTGKYVRSDIDAGLNGVLRFAYAVDNGIEISGSVAVELKISDFTGD